MDSSLMRGDGWVCCAICAAYHTDPYPRLAVDIEGNRWDVCSGACAEEAGIREHHDSKMRNRLARP